MSIFEEEFRKMAEEIGFGFKICLLHKGIEYGISAFGSEDGDEAEKALRRVVRAMETTMMGKGMVPPGSFGWPKSKP